MPITFKIYFHKFSHHNFQVSFDGGCQTNHMECLPTRFNLLTAQRKIEKLFPDILSTSKVTPSVEYTLHMYFK
jgi:hypothetical protein